MRGRGASLIEKFRNLNRRGLWPLVSVEKDSHAQPPLAAMAVFPLLALPPEEQLGIDLCVPLDSRTHASGCALRSTWLWSRRLTEPPRPANVGERSNHKISASKG